MAYLTPDTPRRRVAALGAVAALHGAMGVAILTGFAGGIIRVIDKDYVPAWTYVDPPKPVPTITPAAEPLQNRHKTASKAEFPTQPDPLPGPDLLLDPGPMPTGSFGGDPLPLIEPLPPRRTPSASYTPRAAHPRTSPGRWVSDADYPANALRKGDQGVTGFEVTVGPDGRVRDCTVTRSSGSAELDAATCAKVSQRARFDPASDERGTVVAGRYANAIRWQIPE
jgi:protein TonB